MSSERTNLPELSVSELSGAIKRQLEDDFSYVRVRGELGRISRPASGHIYLDLKDERAVLAGVIWKGVAAGLAIQPEQGLEVVATGKITTFPGQSKYQMVIDSLAPAGVGALMALLEERKKKLAAEGLFAEESKQALPYMPRHIGVVTSPTGAVIRDILHRLVERFPTRVSVWPVRVQGEGCAVEVARAIDGFNAADGSDGVERPDLIIVARGGGSLEDLWGFNEEIVARAAANSAIPLISAVGHETDWTLLDYVADYRAPTPTAAAERAVPVRLELLNTLTSSHARLNTGVLMGLQARRERLRGLARGLPSLEALLALPRQRFDGVAQRLEGGFLARVAAAKSALVLQTTRLSPRLLSQMSARYEAQLNELHRRLGTALTSGLERKKNQMQASRLKPSFLRQSAVAGRLKLDGLQARGQRSFEVLVARKAEHLAGRTKLLSSLGYKSVLQRGFALVRASDTGAAIHATSDLSIGMRLQLQFADGYAGAVADNLNPQGLKPASKAAKKLSAKDSINDGSPQTDLFS